MLRGSSAKKPPSLTRRLEMLKVGSLGSRSSEGGVTDSGEKGAEGCMWAGSFQLMSVRQRLQFPFIGGKLRHTKGEKNQMQLLVK